jgi:hypothetical protein
MNFLMKLQKHIFTHNSTNRGTYKFKVLVAIVFVTVSVFAAKYSTMQNKTPFAYAINPGDEQVLGYLWMDDIGWISLSSNQDQDPVGSGIQTSASLGLPNYGVGQNQVTKKWRGYAWSSVGWIHFSDTSCPPNTDTDSQHPCGPELVFNPSSGLNELRGFASFVSYSPWWDPYISFSWENDHVGGNGSIDTASGTKYGISESGGQFLSTLTGLATDPAYAWHSDGGWIEFSGINIQQPLPGPTIHLKATLYNSFLPSGIGGPADTAPADLILPGNFASGPSDNIRLTWYQDVGAPAYSSCVSEIDFVTPYSGAATPPEWDHLYNPGNPITLTDISTGVETGEFFYFTPASVDYLLKCTRASDNVVETAKANVSQAVLPPNSTCSVSYGWQQAPSSCLPSGNFDPQVITWSAAQGTNGIALSNCSAASTNGAWNSGNIGFNGSHAFNIDRTTPFSTYTISCVDVANNTCTALNLPLEANYDISSCSGSGTPTPPACSNGADDELPTGDGKIDFDGSTQSPANSSPIDNGCVHPNDTDESDKPNPCSDGIDNDGDGKIDWSGLTGNTNPDFGCTSKDDKSERAGIFQER